MSKYDSDPDFCEWWQMYPLKKGKAVAFKEWKKADRLPIDQMLSILQEQITKERQWQNKQYIPHGSTYLHQERWEDEVVPTTPKQIETPFDRSIAAARAYIARIGSNTLDTHGSTVREPVGEQLRLGWG